MCIAQLFKLIGLGLNFYGGVILWKYPLMLHDANSVIVPGANEIVLFKEMRNLGMALLAIGFLLQFIGNLF
jgi:hypothetical protein